MIFVVGGLCLVSGSPVFCSITWSNGATVIWGFAWPGISMMVHLHGCQLRCDVILELTWRFPLQHYTLPSAGLSMWFWDWNIVARFQERASLVWVIQDEGSERWESSSGLNPEFPDCCSHYILLVKAITEAALLLGQKE